MRRGITTSWIVSLGAISIISTPDRPYHGLIVSAFSVTRHPRIRPNNQNNNVVVGPRHRSLVFQPSPNDRRPIPLCAQETNDDDDDDDTHAPNAVVVTKEKTRERDAANALREQAKRIRREAERMERVLMLEKVNALEKELRDMNRDHGHDHNQNNQRKEQIRLQMEQIAQRIDPSFVPRPSSTVVTTSTATATDTTSTNVTDEIPVVVQSSSTTNVSSMPVRDMLTPTELYEACMYFRQLPPQVRVALAFCVGEILSSSDDETTFDPQLFTKEYPESIVAKLWLQQDDLLQTDGGDDPLRESMLLQLRSFAWKAEPFSPRTKKTSLTVDIKDRESLEDFYALLQEMGNFTEELDKGISELENPTTAVVKRTFVENNFPKRTREREEDKEDGPDQTNAQAFFDGVLLATKEVLKNDANVTSVTKQQLVFNPTSPPEAVPGGYVIRGDTAFNASDVVAALDEAYQRALPDDYEQFNFYYVKDPTGRGFDFELFGVEDTTDIDTPDELPMFVKPVLYLTRRDITPTTRGWVLNTLNLCSLGLLVLFCLGTLGQNPLVMTKLNEITASPASSTDLDWFGNQLLLPELASLAAIQFAHESAHWIVATRLHRFKLAPPTFLPCVGSLPFFGAATPVKTSPPNLTALFDFAVAGPVAGLLASAVSLYAGLLLTLRADPLTQFPLLPLLPLDLLRSSALGGSVVDSFLYGGMMNDVLQTGGTTMVEGSGVIEGNLVQLHPLAIGGFCGLIVNALNLLPLGNTDGGRMSLTIFGRNGQTVLQFFTYTIMLGTGVFGGDKQNILLGYALLISLGQDEPEIPCREEVDNLPIPRVLTAFALWFVAVLILLPLDN